eukprot:TRINITY_DN17038_c0_g1_i1.p1 TRINITY_DN17038_c0_g1~~TRINITY_DN17038_c0_g1_i1.p1  ORF type:complete len:256 (+),score=17.29 TRINITY_DN17038_c0_g1_i1:44-769(+)
MTVGRKLTIGLIGATGCLSVWQANRYVWKHNMIQNRVNIINSDPVDLPKNIPEDILRVTCTGTMLNDGYILVGPRMRILTEAGEMPDDRQIYCVIVPMLTSKGEFVWINRGQVQINDETPVIDRLNSWPSKCTITGMIREPPRVVSKLNSGRIFSRAQPKAMWEYYSEKTGGIPAGIPLLPYIVDLTKFEGVDPQPLYPLMRADNDFVAHTIAPFTHLSYCATWTGSFLFGLWYLSNASAV